MPNTAASRQRKIIVVPRPLEAFFYERLVERYADSPGVLVVVDRRIGERRAKRWSVGPGPLTERRRGDRREGAVAWSLQDMPFAVS